MVWDRQHRGIHYRILRNPSPLAGHSHRSDIDARRVSFLILCARDPVSYPIRPCSGISFAPSVIALLVTVVAGTCAQVDDEYTPRVGVTASAVASSMGHMASMMGANEDGARAPARWHASGDDAQDAEVVPAAGRPLPGPATYGHFSREDNLRYVGIGCCVIL